MLQHAPVMEYRNLGRSGLKVSRTALGSWLTFGAALDPAGAGRLVAEAVELGVNLLDTADVYRSGEGETLLGRAIQSLPRHRLVLASKCYFPMSDDPNDRGLSRKHIHESIDGSLRRLGTDYLDLYQCHRFDPETPLLETAAAMDDLIRRGKVLYWGVSQWPAERITEVVDLCRRERLHAPISNQPLYNLFERGIEVDVLPASERAGLGQIVYSPLAQGVLSGKYLPGQAPPPGSRATDAQSNQFLGRYTTPERLRQAAAFAAFARSRGATPAGLALAFCLRDARVTSVIVGASSGAQLRENITGAGQVHPPEVWQHVERLFAA